jgi:hypothetical protein
MTKEGRPVRGVTVARAGILPGDGRNPVPTFVFE